MRFGSPLEARKAGMETVHQTLALSPALSISENMFMGREIRRAGVLGKWLRMLDKPDMDKFAREKLSEPGQVFDRTRELSVAGGGGRGTV